MSWRGVAAVAVYCVLGASMLLLNPGLQYDEALLVSGAVHMLNSPGPPTLPHDPHTWIPAFGRWLPLMTVRYVGAVKEYLCLPAFAIAGAHSEIIRAVSLLLGAIGIWGLARLVAEQVNRTAGVATAAILAINPAYVGMTVFDNGTVSAWMAAFGLLCAGTARYLRRRDSVSALLVGCAAGAGIWARANFVWLIAAVCLAVILTRGRRALLPWGHIATLAAGTLIGAAPFLVYQVVSRGGTFEALSMFSSNEPLAERLLNRSVMFAETLLSDREHRAMWGGGAIAAWQRIAFAGFAIGATAVCLLSRTPFARILAITFAGLAILLFRSGLPVAEHHLIVLVPLTAAVAATAGSMLAQKGRGPLALCVAAASVYVASAAYAHVEAARGLSRTGGVGPWSDSIFSVSDFLQQEHRNQEITILDWGLQNNLYVLTNGRLRSREVLSLEAASHPSQSYWGNEMARGGVFLTNAAENRQFPEPSATFLRALAETRMPSRRFLFRQRTGVPYAELIATAPQTDAPSRAAPPSTVLTSDAGTSSQLEGFHSIEANGWRWTKRLFAVVLGASPDMLQRGATLELSLYIPESILRRVGPITVEARVGERSLGRETMRQPGRHTFRRPVPRAWLKAGPNRIAFALDKYVAPSREDGRELGVIVSSASLQAGNQKAP